MEEILSLPMNEELKTMLRNAQKVTGAPLEETVIEALCGGLDRLLSENTITQEVDPDLFQNVIAHVGLIDRIVKEVNSGFNDSDRINKAADLLGQYDEWLGRAREFLAGLE